MKNIRKEILVWIQLVSFVAIWAAVLFFSRTSLKIEWEAIKKLPDVVTIYVLLVLIFTNWAWRLPIFKGWLVPFPDLQGTWKGTLQSTWIDPATSQKIQPKDVMLVIKQTFSNISCVMYTDESNSARLARDICDSVRAREIKHENSEVNEFVTISIGVACCIADEALNEEILITRADEMLYKAKDSGRDRYNITTNVSEAKPQVVNEVSA